MRKERVLHKLLVWGVSVDCLKLLELHHDFRKNYTNITSVNTPQLRLYV